MGKCGWNSDCLDSIVSLQGKQHVRYGQIELSVVHARCGDLQCANTKGIKDTELDPIVACVASVTFKQGLRSFKALIGSKSRIFTVLRCSEEVGEGGLSS